MNSDVIKPLTYLEIEFYLIVEYGSDGAEPEEVLL